MICKLHSITSGRVSKRIIKIPMNKRFSAVAEDRFSYANQLSINTNFIFIQIFTSWIPPSGDRIEWFGVK